MATPSSAKAPDRCESGPAAPSSPFATNLPFLHSFVALSPSPPSCGSSASALRTFPLRLPSCSSPSARPLLAHVRELEGLAALVSGGHGVQVGESGGAHAVDGAEVLQDGRRLLHLLRRVSVLLLLEEVPPPLGPRVLEPHLRRKNVVVVVVVMVEVVESCKVVVGGSGSRARWWWRWLMDLLSHTYEHPFALTCMLSRRSVL